VCGAIVRSLLFLFLLACVGCSGDLNASPSSGSSTRSFQGLPSPASLARSAPAKSASGSNAAQVRLLQSDGSQYLPWPDYSANAEVSGTDAVIHSLPGELSYVIFQLGTPLVDNTETLTEVRLDHSWVTEPTTPEGLYIGFADNEADRWVWINAAEANGASHDIESLDIQGADPVTQPSGSFIAVVNFSSSDVTVDDIAVRFKTTESVAEDEWIYFTGEGDPVGRTTVSRVALSGGPAEVIHEDTVDNDPFGEPVVINLNGEWKLDYARAGFHPPYLCRSELDGSGEIILHDEPNGYNPCSHRYGTSYGIYRRGGATSIELWGYDGTDEGRLGRDTDTYLSAVWDLSLDPSMEYGAIGSLMLDSVNSYFALVHVNGNPPFPINATPTQIYTRLPTEDAQNPDMVELATLAGDPRYYIYFEARNRDDGSFNIYRVAYPGVNEPEPVLVDASQDLRYPAVSPDGRWLAYQRLTLGSTYNDAGFIVVTSLLEPQLESGILATGLRRLSWYDPTP
jgi:hypothetical protein